MTHNPPAAGLLLLFVALAPLYTPSIATAQTPRSDPAVTRPSSTPIADVGARLVAQAAAQTKMRMAPRYKWTAFGLLIGGAMTTLTGALFADEVCVETLSWLEEDCDEFQAVWVGSGVAIAGAGAIVAIIGQNKREPVTNDVVIGRNRAAWRVRF